MGLERGPLSLVNTTEKLLGRNSSSSGLENREYGHGVPLCWPRDIHYTQKLALTSPTSSGRSFGIVLSQTKAKGFSFGLCTSISGCSYGYGLNVWKIFLVHLISLKICLKINKAGWISLNTRPSPLTWMFSLYNLSMDHIGDTASNSSTVVCGHMFSVQPSSQNIRKTLQS
jgi:hypothetical protein